MSTRFTSNRLIKSVAFASVAAATGGIGIYAYPKRQLDTSERVGVPLLNKEGDFIIPQFPKLKSRAEQIKDLKRSSAPRHTQTTNTKSDEDSIYDLLVIGGGATGTGIALDAATRGLKVALVEREDFSSGTSSKSTKLIHGGVRYLEKAFFNLDYEQYKLVKEALSERQHFQIVAPHLSSWIPIMLPLQHWWQAPYFWAGAKAYDLLAGSQNFKSSYFMSRNAALEAFPMQKKENLIGALVYYDGQQNDSRMNVSLATTAALYGTTIVNHLEVTGLEKDSTGKLCGAKVRDLIADKNSNFSGMEEFSIRARGVINATGPYVDAILRMDVPGMREIVAPSSGAHIVLPGHFTPEDMGLIDPSSSDGRVIFMLPWEGCTIAGTTDALSNISQNPIPSEGDINFVLNEVRRYIAPEILLKRSDVQAAWSGIRPLVRDPAAKNTESLVRNHMVTVSDSGLLTCAGGKWTTYRQMSEEAVDEAVKLFQLKPITAKMNAANVLLGSLQGFNDIPAIDGLCQTRRVRLTGAHGYSATLPITLAQYFQVDIDIAKHLARSYGDRSWAILASEANGSNNSSPKRLSPKYPFIDNEVRYAIKNEYAQTAVDILARRTRLSFLDVHAALNALPEVIAIMGKELSWDEARKEVEWKETVSFLESMGLPASMLGVTREEVLSQKWRQPTPSTPIGNSPNKIGALIKPSLEEAGSLIPTASVG